MSFKTKISVIICTHNAEFYLPNLISSINSQTLQEYEIIFMDAFSKDKTVQLINSYKKNNPRISIYTNKKKLPEGSGFGKSQAFEKASGEVIGFIDQDNVLQSNEIFQTAYNILSSDSKALGVLAGLKHDFSDKKVIRYVSLVGTDSFFAYRSIDFLRNIYKFKSQKNNSHKIELLQLSADNMPITGGNCFFYSSKYLKKIGGYTQDVLVIKRLIEYSHNKLYIIKNATKHYAESSLLNLIKKKFFWAKKFQKQKKENFNYLPKTKLERHFFLRNIFFNILVFPNFYYSLRLFSSSKDLISFLFPILAFLNTIAYLSNFIFYFSLKNESLKYS